VVVGNHFQAVQDVDAVSRADHDAAVHARVHVVLGSIL
jgi:hypothetical protein